MAKSTPRVRAWRWLRSKTTYNRFLKRDETTFSALKERKLATRASITLMRPIDEEMCPHLKREQVTWTLWKMAEMNGWVPKNATFKGEDGVL